MTIRLPKLLLAACFVLPLLSTQSFAAYRHHHAHVTRAHNDAGVTLFDGDRYSSIVAAPTSGQAGAGHGARRSRLAIAQPARERRVAQRLGSGIITIATAANIDIVVDREFASAIQGFIGDAVARGYHPRRISCYSWGRSHVANSLHHVGRACDFDQSGWGRTAGFMYHVADLARKWGLRDGGEFRDWGHIDMGPHLTRKRRIAVVHATPFYGPTYEFKSRSETSGSL